LFTPMLHEVAAGDPINGVLARKAIPHFPGAP
jgi:hypothetical protein